LNGVALISTASNTLTITNNKFSIGALTSGLLAFNGDLDDVRIYNRALTQTEIQALVQQPNKQIFVSNDIFNGAMARGGIAPGTGATGTLKADNWCNLDSNKPNTSTYKAMLASSDRLACISTNCSTSGLKENRDWVLRPNITYIRAGSLLPIYNSTFNGIWDLSAPPPNDISASPIVVWTGLGPSWGIDSNRCSDWTSGVGLNDGMRGLSATSTASQYISWSTFNCTANLKLYCVEQ
jgi:hypothetical protein